MLLTHLRGGLRLRRPGLQTRATRLCIPYFALKSAGFFPFWNWPKPKKVGS